MCEDESGNSIDCTLIGAIMVNGPDTDCQVDGFEDDESKHCNDGIDNDGDGLIDCFDYNCTSQCGQEFSITLVLNNEGVGDVKYKENPDKTYKLNTINIQVPDNWIETFDINGINEYSDIIPVWKKEHQAENDIIEYTLNYDEIKDLLSNNRCSIGENSSDPATICDLLYDSLQDVWLVRGEETRIQISFIRPLVKEVTIDKVSAYGDYGYVIDTRDFGKSITINVNQ